MVQWPSSLPARLARSFRKFLFAVTACLPFGAAFELAAEPPADEIFGYRIEHERWGEIGTFRNHIRREGPMTYIETRMRIAVRLLFFVVYREETDRKEVWNGGRLVAYEAETDLNGETIRISGRAEGDAFVIDGADGPETAPPDVIPTNPWSGLVKRAKTVMGTTHGYVVPVAVTIQEGQTLALPDRDVTSSHIVVTPEADPGSMPFPQEVWLDENDIPVAFAVTKNGKRTRFIMDNYQDVLGARQ